MEGQGVPEAGFECVDPLAVFWLACCNHIRANGLALLVVFHSQKLL